jgi:hypothetical protein
MTAPGPSGEPESDADLQRLALAFAQLYLEVESGRRPRHAVEPMMEPRLCAKLKDHWLRPGPLRTPTAVRVARCGPDCFEAAVSVCGARRVGALALRLQRRGGRWRVVEAARPEDGPLPEGEMPPEGELCAFELVLPPRERRPDLAGVIPLASFDQVPLPAAVGL